MHTNLLQLQRYHGCLPVNDEQLLDICRHYYQEGLKLGRHLVSTVNQPADFYAILASHILIQKFYESCNYIFKCSGEIVYVISQWRDRLNVRWTNITLG